MHIVLQGARGYSASKAASNSAPSSDAAVTSCLQAAWRLEQTRSASVSKDRRWNRYWYAHFTDALL